MRRSLVVTALAASLSLGIAVAAQAGGQTCVTACEAKAGKCTAECRKELGLSQRECEMECARTLFVPCFQRCSQDGSIDYDDYEIKQPERRKE